MLRCDALFAAALARQLATLFELFDGGRHCRSPSWPEPSIIASAGQPHGLSFVAVQQH
jgi:hypothetical protein